MIKVKKNKLAILEDATKNILKDAAKNTIVKKIIESDNAIKIKNTIESTGIKEPGDSFFGYITKNGLQVLTVITGYGEVKYSATRYPTGTIHETRTIRPK